MKRKFFIRRMVLYLSMMLIPMCCLLAVTLWRNFTGVAHTLRHQGEQTVEAAETHIDLVLSNVLAENEMLTATSRMNLSLRRVLSRSEMSYSDAMNVESLLAILRSIANAHGYVESIYLYCDGAGRFLSSERGVRALNEGEDLAWLSTYQEMPDDLDNWIEARKLMYGSIELRSVLTIYKRLLLQDGCVVVNLNQDSFEAALEKQVGDADELLFMTNRDGEILAQTSEMISANDFSDFLCQNQNLFWKNAEVTGETESSMEAAMMHQNQAVDVGKNRQMGYAAGALVVLNGTWQRIGGKDYLLSVRYDKAMDLYLFSAISSKARLESIASIFGFFMMLLVPALIVIAVIAYRSTKRTFDQISYMIHVFDESEKGLPVAKPKKQTHDEYDVIMNNIIYLFLNTNYLNRQLKENEIARERAEMTALQLQINPHFLYNTLQTVDMEIRAGKASAEEISGIVRKVSDILKYALGKASQTVTVGEELAYLKKYVAIQKYRFGDSFIIYYEVDEEILDAQLFKLCLQPLVENSLLHGLRGLSRRGYIKVYLQKRGDLLRCCVLDTGCGMTRSELIALRERLKSEDARGIGIVNLNKRLLLLYGEQAALKIWSKEGCGTAIHFCVPVSFFTPKQKDDTSKDESA